MYFAIIGNHPDIALKELQLVSPITVEKKADHIILFDTKFPHQLPFLSSLIKWGSVVENAELATLLPGKKILGTADTARGLTMKKKFLLKRFKKVDLLHTDKEVKEKGIELITLPSMQGYCGIVEGYQNIQLYEIVDFEKPARSMQTGMMPAKLTHALINIGIASLKKRTKMLPEQLLIFDPFCGTGTTGFVANALGYHFIGSDIKLNFALQNQQRRKQTQHYHHQLFSFIEQDISKPLDADKFQELLTHQTLIITEGRLGPVIKQTTTAEQIKEYQRRVKNLYLQFIQTITDFFPQKDKPTMVFSIPYYIGQENSIEEQILFLTQNLGWKMETINEVYKREQQKVGRKIVILQ